MKPQVTVEGRSLLFNAFFVTLNLAGVSYLAMGFHEHYADKATLFKLIGIVLIMISIGGLVIFRGRLLMSGVARVLVGGLFIVSGLVKANDPIGFSYKLEEYFEDGALAYRIKEWFGAPGFSLEWLIEHALFLSILICIAEIVLGVLTIIGGKMKLVSYLLMSMMLFFTFLTWHTANCNAKTKFADQDTYALSDPLAQTKMDLAKESKDVKIISKTGTEVVIQEMRHPQCVTDCGCFGDALKGSLGRSLTPRESMWKDFILVYLCLWIFLAQWIIKPNTRKQNLVFATSSLLVIILFSWVFGWYFPVFFGAIGILSALWMRRVGGKLLGNYGGSAFIVTVLCGFLVTYVLMYEPLKDYRPYAVGSNIWEKMNDGVSGITESMLLYKNTKTGETREYSSSSSEYGASKIWENPDFKFVKMIDKVIVPGKLASIDSSQFNPFRNVREVSDYEMEIPSIREQMEHAFIPALKIVNLQTKKESTVPMTEYNVTDYPVESYTVLDTIRLPNPEMTEVSLLNTILKSKKIVLVIARDLETMNGSSMKDIQAIYAACKKNKVPFALVCGSGKEAIENFRERFHFKAPVFVNDGTEMKVITRSNPSLMVIEHGVIKAKYPHRSIPTKEVFKEKHLN